MIKHKIEVVENVTNVANINPERPYEQVVADCMKDYLKYRKLEEQGLLLKLPCKVGDKVYSVTRGFISKYIICSIQKYTEGFFFDWKCEEGIYANTRGFTEFEIGKTVFLTKEEAEQKLKEMESDTNGKN